MEDWYSRRRQPRLGREQLFALLQVCQALVQLRVLKSDLVPAHEHREDRDALRVHICQWSTEF
jgi:hypothetical protein